MAEDNRAINELMKLYSQVWLGLGKRQRVEEREREARVDLFLLMTLLSQNEFPHI